MSAKLEIESFAISIRAALTDLPSAFNHSALVGFSESDPDGGKNGARALDQLRRTHLFLLFVGFL